MAQKYINVLLAAFSGRRRLQHSLTGKIAIGSVAIMGVACSESDDNPTPAPSTDGGPDVVVESGTETGTKPEGGTPVPEAGTTASGRLSTEAVDKVDLLFMVDNSRSMGDKQQVLAIAVPDLIARLTDPDCVNATNAADHKRNIGWQNSCPAGYKREFRPITNIHIAVISSSLGGYGSDVCTAMSSSNGANADMAHLIPREADKRASLTWAGKGFLNWDPEGIATPPGTNDAAKLTAGFNDLVMAVGQDGCGYEAQLESWYRFLVDPSPYKEIVAVKCQASATAESCRKPSGVDETVLAQRSDFLRPDSLVATLMLTDENDCSLRVSPEAAMDYFGIHMARPKYRATEECAKTPNHPDCTSCGIKPDDPNCRTQYTDPEDPANLRCFKMKERFGIDYLWPVQRYINGLTKAKFTEADIVYNTGFTPMTATNPAGQLNPLFCPRYANKEGTECATRLRDPSLIFLGGIVGVPWQDLANNPSDLKTGYRPTKQLAWREAEFKAAGQQAPGGVTTTTSLWDIILGDPIGKPGSADPKDQPKESLDPLMRESVGPRTGTSPVIGKPVAAGQANPANGTEYAWPSGSSTDDLQYACIFQLPVPRSCDEGNTNCDCFDFETPLCRNPQTGAWAQDTQYFAKAYPSLRELAVLKGIGEQAIVSSICAANMSDPSAVDYGYRPAVTAMVDRLKSAIQGKCLERSLEVDANGRVSCVILEATRGTLKSDGGTGVYECPACDLGSAKPGRREATVSEKSWLEANDDYKSNNLHCACEIVQSPDLEGCTKNPDADVLQDSPGWCYVDPKFGGAEELVSSCPTDSQRIIRFVGRNIPRPEAILFLQCKP